MPPLLRLLVQRGLFFVPLFVTVACAREPMPPVNPPLVASDLFADALLKLDGSAVHEAELRLPAASEVDVSGEFRILRKERVPTRIEIVMLAHAPGSEPDPKRPGSDDLICARKSASLKIEGEHASFAARLKLPPRPGQYELRVSGYEMTGEQDGSKRFAITRLIVRVTAGASR